MFKLDYVENISIKCNWFLKFFVFVIMLSSYIASAQVLQLPDGGEIESLEYATSILENTEPREDNPNLHRVNIDQVFLLNVMPYHSDKWTDFILEDGTQDPFFNDPQRLQEEEAEIERVETEIEEAREAIEEERMKLERKKLYPSQHDFQHQEFVHMQHRGLVESLEIISDEVRELNENLTRLAASHNLHLITDVAFKHNMRTLNYNLSRGSISLDMANSHVYLNDKNSPSYILSPEKLPRSEFTQGISFEDIMTGSTSALSEEIQGQLRWIFQDFQKKIKTSSIQRNYRSLRKKMIRKTRRQFITRAESIITGGILITLTASYFLLPEGEQEIVTQLFINFSGPFVQSIKDFVEKNIGYHLNLRQINIECIKNLI